MVVVKKSLNLLEEERLTEKSGNILFCMTKVIGYMGKDAASNTWNKTAKKVNFLENGKIIS